MTSFSLDRRRRMRRLNFYHATEGDHLLRWQLWRSVLLARSVVMDQYQQDLHRRFNHGGPR